VKFEEAYYQKVTVVDNPAAAENPEQVALPVGIHRVECYQDSVVDSQSGVVVEEFDPVRSN